MSSWTAGVHEPRGLAACRQRAGREALAGHQRRRQSTPDDSVPSQCAARCVCPRQQPAHIIGRRRESKDPPPPPFGKLPFDEEGPGHGRAAEACLSVGDERLARPQKHGHNSNCRVLDRSFFSFFVIARDPCQTRSIGIYHHPLLIVLQIVARENKRSYRSCGHTPGPGFTATRKMGSCSPASTSTARQHISAKT